VKLEWADLRGDHTEWSTQNGRYKATFKGLDHNGVSQWELFWRDGEGPWVWKSRSLTACKKMAQQIEDKRDNGDNT
jgi:hypothetical protein